MPLKMPGYLAMDLLGKVMVLASVGVQLLILTPLSDERANFRMESLLSIALSTQKINMLNLGVETKPSLAKSEIAARLASDYSFIVNSAEIFEVKKPQSASLARTCVIATFTIGTLLTLLGTYFEKRKKPAARQLA